jgi:hypothetical protein
MDSLRLSDGTTFNGDDDCKKGESKSVKPRGQQPVRIWNRLCGGMFLVPLVKTRDVGMTPGGFPKRFSR